MFGPCSRWRAQSKAAEGEGDERRVQTQTHRRVCFDLHKHWEVSARGEFNYEIKVV